MNRRTPLVLLALLLAVGSLQDDPGVARDAARRRVGARHRATEVAADRALVADLHAGHRAGGVGHVAIQIAVARGANVYSTVSGPEKAAVVTNLGATPINYRENSVEEYVAAHTDGAGFDIVYDTVGGENIPKSWAAARVKGTVISCQNNSTQDMTPVHMKALLHVGVLMLIPLLHGAGAAAHGQIMREVTALAEAGQICPLMDGEPYALEDVAEAHARLESGQATGKVVVLVSG